jgi:tape measure domain-containing protein
MSRISELVVKISANSEGFRQQLREVNAELLRSQSTVARQTQGFANLGAGLQGFGGALIGGVTLPLAAVAAGAVKAFGEIDALKKALFTIEGTAAGTEARFLKLAKAAELPGLGLEQAVRADVRLRAIGISAELSERAILGIGKALAGAGSGAADLDETIRQFGQLASASNLTAENLKPIIERVPQAGKLLREAFGTANAEELRKLGVTSQQVVDLLINGFEKLPPVASGIKNNLENLAQSGRLAFAEIGKAIEPAANTLINFAASVVSKIPEVARAFSQLPQPVQAAALGLAGFAGISGVGIYTIGTLLGSISGIVTGVGTIGSVLQSLAATSIGKAVAAMFSFQGSVTAASIAMGTLNAALAAAPYIGLAFAVYSLGDAIANLVPAQRNADEMGRKLADSQAVLVISLRQAGFAVDDLRRQLKNGEISYDQYQASLRNMAIELGKSKVKAEEKKTTVTGLAKETLAASEATEQLANGTGLLARVTRESLILKEAQNILLAEQSKRIRQAAEDWLLYREFLSGIVPAVEQAKVSLTDLAAAAGIVLQVPTLTPPEVVDTSAQIEAIKRTQGEQDSAYEQSKRSLDEYNKKQRGTARIGVEAMRQIRRATREVSDGIADAIFNGKDFGETMGRIAKSIGQNLTSFVLQKLIEATGLLKGFDRILTGVIKNAAGGALSTVGGSAGGAAGSAAGGVAGAAGSAAGAGISGIVGAVAGVATAASSIFGNFQAAATNKTLDIVAKHTLETKNELANLRADEFRRKDELFTKLDDLLRFTWVKLDEITNAVRVGSPAGNGGGSGINVTVNGGLILGQNAVSQLADLLLAEFRLRGVVAR